MKCFYVGVQARKEGAMADEARVRKVQERILQTVASMIGRHVKDPRLEMVTITDVRVTGDLQHASVFYTVFGDDE